MVAAILGPGRGAEEVGTAARLGEALGREEFALEQRRDIAFFLGIGAVAEDGVAHKVGANAKDAGEFVAQAADFLRHRARRHPIEPRPPQRTGWRPQQPAVRCLAQPLLRKVNSLCIHI